MPSGLTKMMFRAEAFEVRGSRFEPEADGTFDVRGSTFEGESETCESLVFNIGPRTSLSHSHSTSNLEPLRVILLNLEPRTSNLFESFSSPPSHQPTAPRLFAVCPHRIAHDVRINGR